MLNTEYFNTANIKNNEQRLLGTLLHEVKHWIDAKEGQLPIRTNLEEEQTLDEIKKELAYNDIEGIKKIALRKLKDFNTYWTNPLTKEDVNSMF